MPSVDSTKLAADLSDRSSTHLRLKMERSKTVAFSKTVVTPSVFLSIAVCFVGLIHVEIELYAHREMLRVLNHQSEEKVELPNTVRVSRTLHSGLSGGESVIIALLLIIQFMQSWHQDAKAAAS